MFVGVKRLYTPLIYRLNFWLFALGGLQRIPSILLVVDIAVLVVIWYRVKRRKSLREKSSVLCMHFCEGFE